MKTDSILVHSKDHCKVCRRPVGMGYIVDHRIYCAECFYIEQNRRYNEIILAINGTIIGKYRK